MPLLNGGGYTTQFVIYGAGNLDVHSQPAAVRQRGSISKRDFSHVRYGVPTASWLG